MESLITCFDVAKGSCGIVAVEVGDKIGVTDDLLRLSRGQAEHVDDLIQDLEQALAAEEAGI